MNIKRNTKRTKFFRELVIPFWFYPNHSTNRKRSFAHTHTNIQSFKSWLFKHFQSFIDSSIIFSISLSFFLFLFLQTYCVHHHRVRIFVNVTNTFSFSIGFLKELQSIVLFISQPFAVTRLLISNWLDQSSGNFNSP